MYHFLFIYYSPFADGQMMGIFVQFIAPSTLEKISTTPVIQLYPFPFLKCFWKFGPHLFLFIIADLTDKIVYDTVDQGFLYLYIFQLEAQVAQYTSKTFVFY